ncbi:Bacterial protein of uncharacterised function (DUF883) [Leminorella richardii]|uniref:Bacterial protein of uncharacterized function (DUF883) n=1 Tax=Leminorella richardii TaxID=158841 RepID=A0A2X4UTB3_9GAMM|nr:YqjD family protein [Leminorella richardii]SQI43097.1 Bacterial protein of uncharacterised function (DUF883) [Leminorella richardii]
MTKKTESVSEPLHEELQTLVDTLEETLQSTTEQSGAEIEKLYTKAEGLLKEARARLSETGGKIVDQTKEVADKADSYVHEKPWASVGIGAAVGLVLGVLLSRR